MQTATSTLFSGPDKAWPLLEARRKVHSYIPEPQKQGSRLKRFHYGTTRNQNRNRRFEDVEHYQVTGSSVGTHAPLWSSCDFREVTNFRGHSSLEHPEALIPASPAPAPGLRGAWASASPHRRPSPPWGERSRGSQSPPTEASTAHTHHKARGFGVRRCAAMGHGFRSLRPRGIPPFSPTGYSPRDCPASPWWPAEGTGSRG